MELAAPNMIESDFREMRELLADYAQRNEVAERSEMNLRFHNMLYKTCGNGQLLFMIQALQAKLGQYMRLIVSTVSGLKRPIREHDEIL